MCISLCRYAHLFITEVYMPNETEEYFTDNRSDHDEEYKLSLRVKMDKKTLDEFASFFPPSPDGNLPSAVRWLFGGRLNFGVYLSNASTSDHPDSINVLISSDCANRHNSDLIAELGGSTLSIFGFNTPEWFFVTKIRKVPAAVGTISNRVIKGDAVFFYNPSPEASCLEQKLCNRIFELPNLMDGKKHINQRITHWDEYLKINEQIAAEAQLLIDYEGYRSSHNISQLIFFAQTKELNSAHLGSDIQLVLHTDFENGHPIHKGPIIGTVGSYDTNAGEICIDLDFDFREMLDAGTAKIPHRAKLFVSKWGDLVQISRLRYGLQTFARGQAANPYLDVFLFDASKARLPAPNAEELHTGNLLQPSLNPEQKRAVEGVINADDMYLIQGPPGTGKTTVIAEICYQNAIRGQKTLIASQTNLAVDNALGKLVHHPKIRALRKGNEQSVQQEGKLFTENNVIAAWLEKTSADCEKQLAPRKDKLQKVAEAEARLGEIANHYAAFNEATRHRNDSGIQKSVLEHRIADLQNRTELFEHDFEEFLTSTDEASHKKLMSNPYDAPSDIIETINSCFRIKQSLDRKRIDIKNSIDAIRGFTQSAESYASLLLTELQKGDKHGEFTPKITTNHQARELSFDMWQAEAESISKALISECTKSKNGIMRIFGVSKSRLQSISALLIAYERFKPETEHVLSAAKQSLKELIDTNPLPERIEALQAMTSELTDGWNDELQAMQSELAEVDQNLADNKQTILQAREEINEFNSHLPFDLRPEAIELVCREDDIESYYKNLWQTLKDDETELAALQEGWCERLCANSEKDYEEFKQLYINNANVIGITCSQSGSREFASLYPVFDVAIIDEVSKATPPELILSVLKAKKIVLVGDHKQLPPMLGSDTYEEVARKLGISAESAEHMKVSLFEELFESAPSKLKTMLSTQYRMHNQIMDSINQFYIKENGYGLRCGLPAPDRERAHHCHGKAIGENDHSLWVDVPLFEENRESRSPVNYSYSNKAECDCIKDILLTINDNLAANGFEGKKRIGIISFYSNQVRMFENEFFSRDFTNRIDKLSLRIGSVDRFQGIECPVVICSFVRNNDRGEIGFAKDPRRVNVALSRAQELSIIVGCTELFCYSNNSPEASAIYKTITQNIFKAGGERSVWDFK